MPDLPFVLPERLEEPDGPTVRGRVQLPAHPDWSTRRELDPTDPIDRRRASELVLREGDLGDPRRAVDPRDPAELFDTLVLPQPIRGLGAVARPADQLTSPMPTTSSSLAA